MRLCVVRPQQLLIVQNECVPSLWCFPFIVRPGVLKFIR